MRRYSAVSSASFGPRAPPAGVNRRVVNAFSPRHDAARFKAGEERAQFRRHQRVEGAATDKRYGMQPPGRKCMTAVERQDFATIDGRRKPAHPIGKRPVAGEPDGNGRLELSRFIRPEVTADHRTAPVNALGYLRVMFAVDDLAETLENLKPHGAQLVGEVVNYEDVYLLCYIRGPEGLLIGLAQELGRA